VPALRVRAPAGRGRGGRRGGPPRAASRGLDGAPARRGDAPFDRAGADGVGGRARARSRGGPAGGGRHRDHQAPGRAAGAPAPPAESPVLRLADRVGRRGVVVLIALLALGIAFPLAARRAPSEVSLPVPLTLLPLPPMVEPGHLEITFEHPLRSGRLRVYV